MSSTILWTTLYWTWAASEALILLVTRTRHGGGNIQDRGSLRVLWLTICFSLTAGLWYAATRLQSPYAAALHLAGILALALGLILRWTAIFTLGRSFSANVAILDTQTLQTNGLFRFVRHPSYSGLLLIFFAIGLHAANWFSAVVIFVPCTVAVLHRIRVEEAALLQAFGPLYANYTAHTRRLIPGLY